MILVWMIAMLLIGGVLCWLVAQRDQELCKWIAVLSVIVAFVLPVYWYFQNQPLVYGDDSWLIHYQVNWIPAFGISFHLAMDGLSFILLLLTFLLGLLSVLCSWNEIREKTGFYFFNLLWTLAGISGVFVAMDLFLFYFFWEVMLVPMYFLIAIWGDSNRRYAAYKFFIFTQAGGLLMLIAILALYFIHAQQSGGLYTFDYFSLLNTSLQPVAARWIMLGFLIAFVIKLPVVPFHNWLPDAHSEAPTAGSLILAGLLLKTGAYGIIRFVLPMFPQSSAEFAWWLMLIGVAGIVYGALLAFAQTDIKRLIAYTSVSHMGFVLLGIFAFNEIALQGVIIQLLAHGVSTGALFVLAGMLKERLHTRDISIMGGLWASMPAMGGIAMVFVMASLGLPMLGNFVAEFLILLGTFSVNPLFAIIASIGLVLSALYSLRIVQKVFLGPSPVLRQQPADFNFREWFIMACLTAAILALGLYPQPVIDILKGTIDRLVSL